MKTFATFSTNLSTGSVRHEMLKGKEHIVVPMVMIVEGVHNGSGGDLYYPPEELSNTPEVWNAKPVVVYHPEINGKGVSACDPLMINQYSIGTILNAKWDADNNRLTAEAWIEPDLAEKIDSRVLEAIENDKMLEVSTGLFLEVENSEGKWGDESYRGIARNYKPDHLAILPDKTGACSVADGAGFLRNQLGDIKVPQYIRAAAAKGIKYYEEGKGGDGLVSKTISEARAMAKGQITENKIIRANAWAKRHVPDLKPGKNSNASDKNFPGPGAVAHYLWGVNPLNPEPARKWFERMSNKVKESMTSNEAGMMNIYRQLSEALPEHISLGEMEWAHIEEVYEKYFVYETGGEYYKLSYDIEEDKAMITGQPEKLIKIVEWRSESGGFIGNENENQEQNKMKDKIQKLLSLPFINEGQKEWIESLDEVALNQLEAIAESASEAINSVEAVSGENAAQVTGNSEPAKTVGEYIEQAPEGIRETLITMQSRIEAEKNEMVKTILEHKRNKFTENQLKAKNVAELEILMEFCKEEKKPAARYDGQADPVKNDATEVEPLVAPSILS